MHCKRITSKEKLIDSLRDIVIKRYEEIGKQLTPDDENNVWYSLLGVYERDGYEKAKGYAISSKLQ